MAEEARQDDVFARLHGKAAHPDFTKILGDPAHIASAVIFGEKGSGKTAIRLQLQEAIELYNIDNPEQKILIIAYDELNPVLDRFARRIRGKNPLTTLQRIRLLDHFDGLLSVAVPDLVDSLLGAKGEGHVELGVQSEKIRKHLPKDVKQDWLLLQALYDRPDLVHHRARTLKRAIRSLGFSWVKPVRWFTIALWVALAGGIGAYMFTHQEAHNYYCIAGLTGITLITLGLTARSISDWLRVAKPAKMLSQQIRVLDRGAASFRISLENMPAKLRNNAALPVDDLDDPRYAMLDRLRSAVKPFGFTNICVLVDRIDEPTLISGDVDRMKAVIWPLLNNKFLQQKQIAFKMMLPLELRHELRKQSTEFYQEARLDKQNLIERLVWPGPTLYDLCNARLAACMDEGAETVSLTDLFDDAVTRQDIVDALDQMRQPRDAFKLLYQAIHQHCSSTTDEEAQWQIPKLTLDQARRDQSQRLEELHRGLRPA